MNTISSHDTDKTYNPSIISIRELSALFEVLFHWILTDGKKETELIAVHFGRSLIVPVGLLKTLSDTSPRDVRRCTCKQTHTHTRLLTAPLNHTPFFHSSSGTQRLNTIHTRPHTTQHRSFPPYAFSIYVCIGTEVISSPRCAECSAANSPVIIQRNTFFPCGKF